MSKLFKLKEWVTVKDAARHLSKVLDEPVCEADVLQLALDGHIKLTVDFPNRAKAKIGHVVPYKDVPLRELPSLTGEGTINFVSGYPLHEIEGEGQLHDESPFLVFSDEVVSIDGLWDLAMLGSERLDIEHALQSFVGGPAITMTNLEGTFLNRPDGTWAALQEQFEDRIVTDTDGRTKKIRGNYYPAGGLGTDCTRVVRTSEILAFQSKLREPVTGKPLSNRERDTLLTIIAALCKDAGYDHAKHAKTAGLIQGAAAKMGVSIGETTIEGHLKKIPDALAGRMK